MGSAFSDELLKQVDETMRKRFEEAHPGVAALYAARKFRLGGPVRVLGLAEGEFPEYRLTPAIHHYRQRADGGAESLQHFSSGMALLRPDLPAKLVGGLSQLFETLAPSMRCAE